METLLQLNDKKELGAYYESKGDIEKAIESYSKGNAWPKVADLAFKENWEILKTHYVDVHIKLAYDI